MNYCPCCTDILLRHTNANGVYWFCRTCWQAMPVSKYQRSDLLTEMSLSHLSEVLDKLEKATSLTASGKINTTSSSKLDVSSMEIVEISR